MRMIVKAQEYYTSDWQDEPVWIESRGAYETNTRYAIIKSGTIPDLGEIYGHSFTHDAALPDLTFETEHDHWTSYSPGTATAVAISASETYDGRNLGNVDSTGTEIATTSEEVYIANQRSEANITDIYVDDGGVWGANLMDAALPYDFLPAVPAVNDAVYFGIDSTLADSGPFWSLVFDIQTAQVGCTIVWEYWNGAWVAFQAVDNTNANGDLTGEPFDTAGVRSMHWTDTAEDWLTRNIALDGGPAITGLFVRARVTVIAAPSPPRQQNRDIYSIIWPYVDIKSDQIGGDISSLLRILLRNRSGSPPTSGFTLEAYASKILVGLRSYDRGSNFTAFINLANEQNPPGITIGVGVNSAFTFRKDTAINVQVRYLPLGVEASAMRASITISSTISNQFLGEFHAFCRVIQEVDTVFELTLEAWLGSSSGTRVHVSEGKPISTNNEEILIDFGIVNLSPKGLSQSDNFDELYLAINSSASAGGGGEAVYFLELILLPVDEWAGVIQRPNEVSNGEDDQFARQDTRTMMLDSGSILKPKEYITSLLQQGDTGYATCVYQTITNGEFILQANKRQRLWFLASHRDEDVAEHSIAHTVRVYKNERYLGPRGDR